MEIFMDGLMYGFIETMVDAMEGPGGAMGAVFDTGIEESDSANHEEADFDEERYYTFGFI